MTSHADAEYYRRPRKAGQLSKVRESTGCLESITMHDFDRPSSGAGRLQVTLRVNPRSLAPGPLIGPVRPARSVSAEDVRAWTISLADTGVR